MQPQSQSYLLPSLSLEELVEYLSSPLFPGIGKKTALLLVEYFGTNVLNILKTEPELLNEIPNLTNYRIEQITKALLKSQNSPTSGALALLLGVGTSLKLALDICERYSQETIKVIQSNPYQLIEDLNGVGFKTVDRLALALGVSPSGEQRHLEALKHVLKEAMREGHCFLPEEILQQKTLEILKLPQYQPHPKAITAAIANAKNLGIVAEGESESSIYLTPALAAELRVASLVLFHHQKPEKNLQPLFDWLIEWEAIEWKELSRPSHEQKSALFMAQARGISILTGGPGRGKTHVLKLLVEWLQNQKQKIALAAPTGKAANRMKEMTNHEAQTIHRLLSWQGAEGKFKYHQGNPLSIDWLIVDEFSMVDIFLFNSLLKALPSECQILLVGDADQLPSIGAGMVLRDLILSEVLPTTRLTKVFRQEGKSDIIHASDQINQGIVPNLIRFSDPRSWSEVGDCALLERDTPQQTQDAICELVKIMKERDFLDLTRDLIVLAPQKEKTAGVHALNKALQPIFNPEGQLKKQVLSGETIYRVGDRVIQLKNCYDTSPPVMNGETGIVIDADPNKSVVTIAFAEGAVVNYSPAQFDQIMHSFAITCHKSQGSEFPCVIMPLLMCHQRMLTRQLLYTTMTRAESTFIAVGQRSALEKAVATDKPARRYTQLTTLLLKEWEEVNYRLTHLKKQLQACNPSTTLVTVASRLKQRDLYAERGQMTSIGSMALKLYEDKYGYRPPKQFEKVGTYSFKTYHYHSDAVELLDRAIDVVLELHTGT